MSTYRKYSEIFAEVVGEVPLRATNQVHQVRAITPELQLLLSVPPSKQDGESDEAASIRQMEEVAARLLIPEVSAEALHRDDAVKLTYILTAASRGARDAEKLLAEDTAAGNGTGPAVTAQPTASA